MMRWQIVAERSGDPSAWTKAPADISAVAATVGYRLLVVGRFRLGPNSIFRRVLRKFRVERIVDRVFFMLEAAIEFSGIKKGDDLLIQYPLPPSLANDAKNMATIARLRAKGVRVSLFIHDIGQLRGQSADVGGKQDHFLENKIFGLADKLIVHNERMSNWLRDNVETKGRIVPLGIFDYLLTDFLKIPARRYDASQVVVAGGLGGGLAGYLQDALKLENIKWHLYGVRSADNPFPEGNYEYHGIVPADEVPARLEGSWGLVWNGSTICTCGGSIGPYLRYINNHKLSLYVVAEMPVVVWSGAAYAGLVRKKGLGICVDSLVGLSDILQKVTEDQYRQMCVNCRELAYDLRRGVFTRKALEDE